MIIIIGTGLAGYSTAKEFRKHDKESPLMLITSDDGANYSKPMLSNALTKDKSPESLAMQSAEKMAETLNATIKTETQVTAINPAQHSVTAGGETYEYSKLVLATGANPITPPLEGDATDDIYTVNSLHHYRSFHPVVGDTETIAIIGPGLIGCEFANDLANIGKTVHVVGPDKTPLSLLLPETAGQALQADLEKQGITFHLGVLPKAVNKKGNGYELTLDNGDTIEADTVLSAVGLRPNTELAEMADLHVERGVIANRLLQTSDPDIYTLGDSAQVEGRVLPYIMPIMHAARALGQTLAGTDTEVKYPAMPVVIKTPAHPIVISAPAPGAEGEWDIEQREDGVKALFKNGDDLLGFALTGSAVSEKQALSKELPPVMG
ncbi:nitric oxide reductase FlRd-NAD(+) reductase [gamma proteobacterium HTCC5015]|nr:nitric oxide reductase FlRd-NAD(+) reductase [gamma proteobacterium HTCC5015]